MADLETLFARLDSRERALEQLLPLADEPMTPFADSISPNAVDRWAELRDARMTGSMPTAYLGTSDLVPEWMEAALEAFLAWQRREGREPSAVRVSTAAKRHLQEYLMDSGVLWGVQTRVDQSIDGVDFE